MSRIDPDHFYAVSLSWRETRTPYPANPEHRPLIDYAIVHRFDSEEDAWDAVKRFWIDLSWAPKWAQDHDVSTPSKIAREQNERTKLRDYLTHVDKAAS